MKPANAVQQEREEAWIGDAVLGLFARRWILERTGRMDAEMFTAMTSNQFLSTIGNPTRMESRIGRRFLDEGLAAACAFIEAEVLPTFLAQQSRGFLALAMVGITLQQIAFRHPVIGGDQHVGPMVKRRIAAFHRLGQSLDVKRRVEIFRHRAGGGLALFLAQGLKKRVIRRG